MVSQIKRRPHWMRWRGFTTIEAAISLVILGVMGGVLGPFIIQSFESWAFSVQQSKSMDHHRHAVATFANDVEDASSVVAMAADSVTLSIGGSSVSYSLVDTGGGTFRLERTEGGVSGPLATDVVTNGFTLRYFDMGHEQTATAADVRVIMITITTNTSDGQTVTSGTSVQLNTGGSVIVTRT